MHPCEVYYIALLISLLRAVHAQFTIGRSTGGQGAPFFRLNRLSLSSPERVIRADSVNMGVGNAGYGHISQIWMCM